MDVRLLEKGQLNSNNIFLFFTIYSLTIFVYRDFSIPQFLGILILSIVIIYYLVTNRIEIRVSDLSVAFSLLIMFQIIQIARTLAMGNSANVLYIPVLLIITACMFCSNANKRSIIIICKFWIIMCVMISLYICVTKIVPEVYYSVFQKLLSDESKAMNDQLITNGYSVAIGAKVIISDDIIAFGVVFCVSSLLLGQGEKYNRNRLYIALTILFLITMVLVNRKTEIIAIGIAIMFLFVSNLNYSSSYQKSRKVVILVVISTVLIAVLYFLYSIDLLGRYGVFIERIVNNIVYGSGKDISSGRLLLWTAAFSLFLDNPIFGIGWGNYSEYVPNAVSVGGVNEIHNVHNCYLQLLCETGIVGTAIFIVLILFIFFKMFQYGIELKNKKADSIYRVLMSSCLAYQLFFLVTAAIDPTFYSLIFWCLYSLSVVMGISIYNNYCHFSRIKRHNEE